MENSCYKNNLLSDSDIVNIASNSLDDVPTSSLLLTVTNDKWCPLIEGIDLPLIINFNFAEVVLLTSLALEGKKTNDVDFFISSYSLSYASNTSCNLTLYEDLFGQSVSIVLPSLIHTIILLYRYFIMIMSEHSFIHFGSPFMSVDFS